MDLGDLRDRVEAVKAQIGRVVLGQEGAVELMLVSLLSRGHTLLEGMPGTAKTLLANTFAASLDLQFQRVQFTPDLMPGDVLGTNLFDFQSHEFRLIRGPIFTQILLADEINRTPPKTQASLLQAMQEREVTIDGVTHGLGDGFMVVATQNPIEHEGTYPLPEAQLDRFLVKIRVDYPSRDAEIQMAHTHGNRAGTADTTELAVEPLADLEWIMAARAAVAELRIGDEVIEYVVDLVRGTRESTSLSVGASPRSINMLCVASRALATLRGRDYVLPDDVKELVEPVLGHRVVLAPGAELEGLSTSRELERITEQVEAPR
ncbi:MAG: MoxR family ATPase [Planctomycetes bacterium]|nr:MoxR family ATPase [Planctomycetota bacterium]